MHGNCSCSIGVPDSRRVSVPGVPSSRATGRAFDCLSAAPPRAARHGSLLGRVWLFAWLAFALFYWAGSSWFFPGVEPVREEVYEQIAIEDTEIHNRLSGYNPLPFDTDRDVPEPTPATHRKVVLEMVKENGLLLEMELTQSLDWIAAVGAEPGGTVYMDLPEFGAVGEATVTAIGPCPAVPPGPGNLVTGIFEHEADNVIDLYLDGAKEPIGCTDNHRFWSEEREDYVEAGHLNPGEKVWTHRLGITTVNAAVPRPGLHRVWNLEVHGEHVYEVGELGVLVHNSYGVRPRDALGRFTSGAGGNTADAARGRAAHKNYRNALGGNYKFEKTLPSGRRVDAVDFDKRIVRELKPNNPRAIKDGQRQLERYRKELQDEFGGTWTSFLETYTP